MGAIQQVLLSEGGGASVPAVYWNPSDKDSKLTLSNANATVLRSTTSDGTWCAIRGLTSHTTGKWYAEIVDDANGSGTGDMLFGVATSTATLTSYVGSDANGWGIQANNTGNLSVYHSGTQTGTGSGANVIIAGGRAMVAYDADSGKIWLGSNGNWYNNGLFPNPATGVGPTYTATAGTALFLALSAAHNPQQCTLKNNSGENIYTIPSGFSMWG